MPLHNSMPLLTVANLLILIAILTFASGFFPYKPFLPGTATFEDVGVDQVPEAPFNKVVFMVVDALRRFGPYCWPYTVWKRLSRAVISSIHLARDSNLLKGI